VGDADKNCRVEFESGAWLQDSIGLSGKSQSGKDAELRQSAGKLREQAISDQQDEIPNPLAREAVLPASNAYHATCRGEQSG